MVAWQFSITRHAAHDVANHLAHGVLREQIVADLVCGQNGDLGSGFVKIGVCALSLACATDEREAAYEKPTRS